MRNAPNPIVCTGYSVEILGWTKLKYEEGDRNLLADIEILSGLGKLVLYERSVTAWEAPYGSAIDKAEQVRIVGRIQSAFRSVGVDIEVM